MKTIRINRKKWHRGQPVGSFLWDSVNCKGCILGHVIHQTQKCSWSELDAKTTPKQYFRGKSLLTREKTKEYHDFYGTLEKSENNSLASKAMQINDDTCILDEVRESHLISVFKDYGIKLKFYN
jgi:hypothetical protein